MNFHDIKHDDMTNGDGIRVTLFVSGCDHHCENCQNKETWNYNSGMPFSFCAQRELEVELSKDYISGITFSGGDPLSITNAPYVAELMRWVRKAFPTKTIWCYTGYKIDELTTFHQKSALRMTDVLVDGEYIEELRDVELKWRGSKNQRVIDVPKTLTEGRIILHCD